jgi:adenylate cyclase class 2
MQTEIEKLFYDINKEEIRNSLKNLGAELKYEEFLQRRAVFDFGFKNDVYSWLRVRNEYDKTVMTYKETRANEFAKEVEVKVGDFEKTIQILKLSGLVLNSWQENFREKYIYKNSELTIDSWPWLEPVLEVESPNEEELNEIIKDLKLDESKSVTGTINVVYKLKYNKYIQDLSPESQLNIKFESPNQFTL